MEHPVERAARTVGSQTALASALGVTKAAVGQWKDEGRRVPAEHCPSIERLSRGTVRCEELRPDVHWDVLRIQSFPGDAHIVISLDAQQEQLLMQAICWGRVNRVSAPVNVERLPSEVVSLVGELRALLIKGQAHAVST